MDVIIFESGREFTIRDVSFSQKILELKEKIQESHGIPITSQTLLFHGQAMVDQRYVDDYKITSGSRVRLLVVVDVKPEPECNATLIISIPISKKTTRRYAMDCDVAENVGQLKKRIGNSSGLDRFALSIGGNALRNDTAALVDCGVGVSHLSEVEVVLKEPPKVPLRIKIEPEYLFENDGTTTKKKKKYFWEKRRDYFWECGVDDTVARLKERITASQGIPESRFVLFVGGYELPDSTTLSDYSLVGYTEGAPPRLGLNVVRRPPLLPAAAAARRMKVAVQSRFGTKRVTVDVSHKDKVGELRRKLEEELQQHFPLPATDYYFVHNKKPMSEDGTFRSHDVKHCNTIEIFFAAGIRAPVTVKEEEGGS